MADWDDPGICPELARHEIWRTRRWKACWVIALEHPAELSARINAAIERLVSFSDKLEKSRHGSAELAGKAVLSPGAAGCIGAWVVKQLREGCHPVVFDIAENRERLD